MPKRRELLILLILAVLAMIVVGYFFNFPLRIAEPAVCIQLLDSTCYPLRILWVNAFLDLLFWSVILVAGWWVVKRVRR